MLYNTLFTALGISGLPDLAVKTKPEYPSTSTDLSFASMKYRDNIAGKRMEMQEAQEVKRPVTSGKGDTDKVHTEPSKAQTVKNRPLASGAEQTNKTEHTNTRQQTQTASRSTKQTTKKTISKKGLRK